MHRRTHAVNTFAVLHHVSADSAMAVSETRQPASYDRQPEMLFSYPLNQADGPIDTTSNNDMRFSDIDTGYGANAFHSLGFVTGSNTYDILQHSGHDSISSFTGPANSMGKEEFHRYILDVRVPRAAPGTMDTVLLDNIWYSVKTHLSILLIQPTLMAQVKIPPLKLWPLQDHRPKRNPILIRRGNSLNHHYCKIVRDLLLAVAGT